jgi:hypothetical protein
MKKTKPSNPEQQAVSARIEDAPAKPQRTISKTPMFTATNAGRYQRQALMKEIESKQMDADLICYVSGDRREIERDDTLGFVDLLHNVPAAKNIDLLLHTGGGDVDTAQKLIEMVHARLGKTGRLRVIVPDFAKSAGTLMALGGDEIVMSDSSELGMIDPQFKLKDERGNEIWTSVVAYLEAYREHADAVRQDPDDPVAAAMLSQFDPVVLRKFQGYRDRTRDIAMRMLNRQGAASTTISEALMDLQRWKSHGQMIGHGDARQLGLNVAYHSPDDKLWLDYWHLYCLQRLEVERDKKIFESVYVSQIFER